MFDLCNFPHISIILSDSLQIYLFNYIYIYIYIYIYTHTHTGKKKGFYKTPRLDEKKKTWSKNEKKKLELSGQYKSAKTLKDLSLHLQNWQTGKEKTNKQKFQFYLPTSFSTVSKGFWVSNKSQSPLTVGRTMRTDFNLDTNSITERKPKSL